MRKIAVVALALAVLAAGCGGADIDYEISGEEPTDLGMVNLTVRVPNGATDEELASVLSDLYVDRVEGDYRIRVVCANGETVARGFLRNSDDERELRRNGEC